MLDVGGDPEGHPGVPRPPDDRPVDNHKRQLPEAGILQSSIRSSAPAWIATPRRAPEASPWRALRVERSVEDSGRIKALKTELRSPTSRTQAREALVRFQEAADRAREHLGPQDRDTLASLNNMASTLDALGHLPEALPLYEDRPEPVWRRGARPGPPARRGQGSGGRRPRAMLTVAEMEDRPLAYLPGNSLRTRVRVVGDIAG